MGGGGVEVRRCGDGDKSTLPRLSVYRESRDEFSFFCDTASSYRTSV